MNIINTYIFHFFIFVIIFCIYLNIIRHITIQDIHYISETDYHDNYSINQLCSLNKPFIFKYYYSSDLDYNFLLNTKYLKLKLYNNKQTYNIPCKKALTLINNSNLDKPYFTYNNSSNINNSEFISNIKNINSDLQPILKTNSKFDIITGTQNHFTPFISHTNFSCFLFLISGSINVSLINSNLYNKLSPLPDPSNIWIKGKKKTNFVYCKMHEKNVLFLPPYVYTSIKFLTKDAVILALYYDTFSSSFYNIFNSISSKILKN